MVWYVHTEGETDVFPDPIKISKKNPWKQKKHIFVKVESNKTF